MKRFLLALGLTAGLAGCTLPTVDDLIQDQVGKLGVDKDVVLAYTEVAMKQAALASAALNAQTQATEKPTASPQFKALLAKAAASRPVKPSAVSIEQCATYSELACTASGVCSYTENYSACGTDYKGEIVRTFEGDFETYKVTVEFKGYQEKTSADTGYFAFDGKSIMTGTIGLSSANLSMHTEGNSSAVFGGVAFTLKTSSDVTFTFLNGVLSVNGTQSSNVVESGQATSMSITELKFDGECAGPLSGTVTTTIDGKESVIAVTGCGQATLTVGGDANPVSTEELAKTFAPKTPASEGLSGLFEGTAADSLLTGAWYYETATEREYLFIQEWEDSVYIDYYYEHDVNADGEFYGVNDEFEGGFGTIVIGDGSFTPQWDFLYSGHWAYDSEMGGNTQMFDSEQNNVAGSAMTFSLKGNSQLIVNGRTYNNLNGTADYAEPGQVGGDEPSASSWELVGYWVYSTATVYETWDIYEDATGFTYLYYQKAIDEDVDGEFYMNTDTNEYAYGELVHDGSSFTPMWNFHATDTFTDDLGNYNVTVHYDAYDNGGTLQTASPLTYSVSGGTATIGGQSFTLSY